MGTTTRSDTGKIFGGMMWQRLLDRWRKMSWQEMSYRGKSIFAVTLSLIILFGGTLYVGNKGLKMWDEYRTAEDYIGQGEGEIDVLIPAGKALFEISDILVEHEVIKSAKKFDQLAMMNSEAANIQPGTYKMKKKMPAQEALDRLMNPNTFMQRNKVTIAEGLTLEQQLKRLSSPINMKDANKSGTGHSMEVLQAAINELGPKMPAWTGGKAEGILFPATYDFQEKATPQQDIQAMIDKFNEVSKVNNFEESCKKAVPDTKMDKVLVCLIVASVIEREVDLRNHAGDGAKVARVLYNRMKANMNWECDSTVYYAVKKESGVNLTKEDLAVDNPYNTYRNPIPPGPISAPGKAAMIAASMPSDAADMQKALFWVTVNYETGVTRFNETIEGHDKDKAEFQKWCKDNLDKCVKK